MSSPVFDLTVDYEEEKKKVVHDIQVQLQPKAPRRPPRDVKRKRRQRVKSRKWTGRWMKKKGGFASAGYAKRYPHLVKRVYRTVVRTKTVEVTARIPGGEWTDDDAFRAFWAAHKVLRKGGTLERDFTDWKVEAIDWRKGGKLYGYGSDDASEVIGAMGGILEDRNTTITAKLAKPRVGEIDR